MKEHKKVSCDEGCVLSEDETAYGKDVMEKAKKGAGQSEQSQPLKLFYPRDISALRGAYQSKSLFDNASSDETQAPRRSLPTDLADPSGIVHDSIHSYGGNQTPLAQKHSCCKSPTRCVNVGHAMLLVRQQSARPAVPDRLPCAASIPTGGW